MPEFLSSQYKSSEGNGISRYPVALFKDLIREKILKRVNVNERIFKVVETKVIPAPGLIDANNIDVEQRETCLLCCQMARFGIGCSRCESAYCGHCAYYLVLIRKCLLNLPIITDRKLLTTNKENFICLNPDCSFENNPVHLVKLDETVRFCLKIKKVKCIYIDCKFIGDYVETCNHVNSCTINGDYRVNTDNLGEIFTNPVEPLFPDEYNTIHFSTVLNKTNDPIKERQLELIQLYHNRYTESIADIDEIFADIEKTREEYGLKRNSPFSVITSDPKKSNPPSPSPFSSSSSFNLPQTSQPSQSTTITNKSSTLSSSSSSDNLPSYWTTEEKDQYKKDLESVSKTISEFDAIKRAKKREKEKLRKQRQKANAPYVNVPDVPNIVYSSSDIRYRSNQQPNINQPAKPSTIPQTIDRSIEVHRQNDLYRSRDDQSSNSSKSIYQSIDRNRFQQINPSIEKSTYNYKSTEPIIKPVKYIIPYVHPAHHSTPEPIIWPDQQLPQPFKLPVIPDIPDADGYNPSMTPCPQPKSRESFRTAKDARHWRWRSKNKVKVYDYKRSQRNRKYLNLKHTISMKSIHHMLPPKHLVETITQAAVDLDNQNIKCCAIDTESIQINMKDGKIRHAPCWISIVDASGNVVYNEFGRHPKSSVFDFNTRFHGLTWQELKDAPKFKQIRAEAIAVLRRYDRIIVSNQTVDFVNLFISPSDHLELLPKIICVSSYYSCRAKPDEALGLKYISFLLLNTIIQEKEHSPIIDAAFTMYSYLLDYKKIEFVREDNLVHGNGTRRVNGYLQYNYPKNMNMAVLLHAVMEEIEDWPLQLKLHPYMTKAKKEEATELTKYQFSDFVFPIKTVNSLPPPYTFNRELLRPFRRLSTRSRVDEPL